jgi:hypothetical protein
MMRHIRALLLAVTGLLLALPAAASSVGIDYAITFVPPTGGAAAPPASTARCSSTRKW